MVSTSIKIQFNFLAIIVCFILFLLSCNSRLIIDCDENNYLKSPNENHQSNFKNKQREIITTFSEKELDILFEDTNLSCKYILSNFFFCNICFSNDYNSLISYSGKKIDIDKTQDPNKFTLKIINLISSMQMGKDEYLHFLNAQKNNFSDNEKELLYHIFKNQKKNSSIKTIKIDTH